MTPQQHMYISESVKCIQLARKWLDMAMYYSDEQMPENEFQKVREAYDLICKANDKL